MSDENDDSEISRGEIILASVLSGAVFGYTIGLISTENEKKELLQKENNVLKKYGDFAESTDSMVIRPEAAYLSTGETVLDTGAFKTVAVRDLMAEQSVKITNLDKYGVPYHSGVAISHGIGFSIVMALCLLYKKASSEFTSPVQKNKETPQRALNAYSSYGCE